MRLSSVPRLPILVVSLSLLLWNASPSVAASPRLPNGAGIVLAPCDSSGNQTAGPGYFEVTSAQGSTTRLFALAGNVQHRRVTIEVVPVDARSGVYGGISYNLPQQRRKFVGAWIGLSGSRFGLGPRKAEVVGMSLRVPAGTAPGQYVGGLTAFVPTSSGATGSNLRAGAIRVQLRRVVAVVVTVPGPQYKRFEVGSVRAKRRPDAVYLITHIHNTGTILLKGHGHLWVWRQGVRKAIVSSNLDVDTTLPHTAVHYPILWSKHPPKGTYRYSVVLTWDGGKNVKTGTFTIN